MKTHSIRAYRGLLGLSAILTILAVITLIPRSGASWPNLLGYRSVCTFTPIATAVCALLAGIVCVIRARIVSQKTEKRSWIPPIVIGVLLIAVIAVYAPKYANTKAEFISGATTRESDSRE